MALTLVGEWDMDYRVYFLDDGGHVFAREDGIAENDELVGSKEACLAFARTARDDR
jgi:hypothetical protein